MKRFQSRIRDERGFIAGGEALAFGVLIFVFGTLFVVGAWSTVDAKLATTAAAREGARAYVEAQSAEDGTSAAELAAGETMRGHGRSLAAIQVSHPNGTFRRCGAVDVTVAGEVTRLSLPLIGASGGTTRVTSKHTEVVDPYRSGLQGAAEC